MSERCPVCFHFLRFCNCPAVVEAERIVAEAQLGTWLRPVRIDLSNHTIRPWWDAHRQPPPIAQWYSKNFFDRWADENDWP